MVLHVSMRTDRHSRISVLPLLLCLYSFRVFCKKYYVSSRQTFSDMPSSARTKQKINMMTNRNRKRTISFGPSICTEQQNILGILLEMTFKLNCCCFQLSRVSRSRCLKYEGTSHIAITVIKNKKNPKTKRDINTVGKSV